MAVLATLFSGTIVFWNVENFFNPELQSQNHSENEFTQTGKMHWTKRRQREKAGRICKLILSLSDSSLQPPRLVALAEVEDEQCLKTLVYGTALRKFGYRYIHYDSPDPRGIDCALLYRDIKPKASRAISLRDSLGKVIPTRDILLAEFDSIAVMVVHLPSKRGGSTVAQQRRQTALATIRSVADSLGSKPCIVIGDFNEERTPLSDSLLGPELKEITPEEWLDASIATDSGMMQGTRPWKRVGRIAKTWGRAKGSTKSEGKRKRVAADWENAKGRAKSEGKMERVAADWENAKGSAKTEGKRKRVAADWGNAKGSIKFEGRWERIDRAQVRGGAKAKMRIVSNGTLLTEDKKYGGVKPLRTYSGPRYLGGTSDHLPIVLTIFLEDAGLSHRSAE